MSHGHIFTTPGGGYADFGGHDHTITGGAGIQSDHGSLGVIGSHTDSHNAFDPSHGLTHTPSSTTIGGTGSLNLGHDWSATGSISHTDVGNGLGINSTSGGLTYHPSDSGFTGSIGVTHNDYSFGGSSDFIGGGVTWNF